MNWRRVADVLGIHRPGELADERSIRAKHLDELERETVAQTKATRQMTTQARLGSYHRVRIGR